MKGACHNKKPQSTRRAAAADESVDEIYNYLKELQKKEKTAKSKLKAAAKIKSSTPTQITRKNRKRPVSTIEISPIRQSLSNTDLTNIEDDEGSLVIPRKRKNKENEKDRSHVLALKDMIAEFHINRELSALNAVDKSSNGIDSILREIENKKNIAPSSPKTIEISEKPKTVFFAPDVEDYTKVRFPPEIRVSSPITLKPGKWRKSLVAWRKSHNPLAIKRRTSRRFEGLFPIKTAPKVVNCFEEIQEQDCKFNVFLLNFKLNSRAHRFRVKSVNHWNRLFKYF